MPNVEPVADGAAIPGWAPVIEDPALAALLRPGAVLHRLATGATWAEGPVWLPQDGSVVWSDVVGNRVLRWDPDGRVSVFLADAEFENGHTLDHDGSIDRLLARPSAHRTPRPRRDAHADRRSLPGSALQLAQRRRRQVRRHDLVHGPALRHHRATARATRPTPRSATASCSGSTRARASSTPSPTGSTSRTASRSRPTSRSSTSRIRPPRPHDDGGGNHHIAAFDVVDGRTPREPARLLHRRRMGARTASASTSRATSGRRPTTGSTSSRRMGGASAGCRSRSGPRTASSAAPTSIACSSPRRRRST